MKLSNSVAQRTERRDSRVDVKGKIGNIEKRLKIKAFKTKGSIFECC